MTEPLNGKDAMDLAVTIMIAQECVGIMNHKVPQIYVWEEIVRRAAQLRDRGDANGYLVSAVVKVEKRR
jgi:hypothetical protein